MYEVVKYLKILNLKKGGFVGVTCFAHVREGA